MNVEKRKIAFVQDFLQLDDEQIINSFEELLAEIKIEHHRSQLKPMSIEEFNQRQRKSMEDSKNDRLIKAEDLKEEIKTWH